MLPRRQIRRPLLAPVTVENTLVVFSDRKTVFRMYSDQLESGRQVHGLSIYFTLDGWMPGFVLAVGTRWVTLLL
jgi:hypothetical protein